MTPRDRVHVFYGLIVLMSMMASSTFAAPVPFFGIHVGKTHYPPVYDVSPYVYLGSVQPNPVSASAFVTPEEVYPSPPGGAFLEAHIVKTPAVSYVPAPVLY
ncbi:unnamed protein product [Darwinula stevensoni]|uniref:Uncharacterized protein n=1 Tax=Darwinula stevensoni TaxID=69355 RepID=A0A7R8X1Z9_9CRUS|nr:unnamed protein product [Darwinula stevensoni]CAG0883304.1 unnamed protein product [Darwinula stevensoni]